MRTSDSQKVSGRKTAGFLCLALGAGPAGAAGFDAVVLSCPETSEALCMALSEELSRRVAPNPVLPAPAAHANALHVKLELTRSSDDHLEGRLIWQLNGDKPHTGPLVEVSSMDRSLNAQALHGFARGLLQVSRLPL